MGRNDSPIQFARSTQLNMITNRTWAVSIPLTMLCILLLSFSNMCRGAGESTMTDGREVLEKSFSTYLRMTSYYGRANTDSLLLDSNGHAIHEIGTSVEIKYKRPNKLFLHFMTPVGSRIVWSNAADLGVYDPGTNKYSIARTAPNLAAMLPLLFRRASITASFDPLYALSRNGLPSQLTHIELKSLSTYNGHPVYVVTGELTGGKTIHWTWCIDRNSLLLYKIEQVSTPFEQEYAYKQGGQVKHGHRMVRVKLRTVVAEARPNTPIEDAAFDYKVPAGATERIMPQKTNDKH